MTSRIHPRDWSEPYFEQAKADLQAAWNIPPENRGSTFCMLLQMVFEKIAKGAYARAGNTIPKTHKIASHFIAVLQRHPAGQSVIVSNPSVFQFIQELELAQPSIAGRTSPPNPQLEYPWIDPATSAVFYPEKDLYLVKRVKDPSDRIALDALRFASYLIKELKVILP